MRPSSDQQHRAWIRPWARIFHKTLEGWDYDPDQISVRVVKAATTAAIRSNCGSTWGCCRWSSTAAPTASAWRDVPRGSSSSSGRNGSTRRNEDTPFRLASEDCARLLREGVQYYHRYISFWHLERYELCARDTNRNLRLFAFVREHAQQTKDKLQFDQWRPYVTMMHARAVATPLIGLRDYRAAFGAIDAGIEAIRGFLKEYDQLHNADNCSELVYLQRWRDEVAAKNDDHSQSMPRSIRWPDCRPSWKKR